MASGINWEKDFGKMIKGTVDDDPKRFPKVSCVCVGDYTELPRLPFIDDSCYKLTPINYDGVVGVGDDGVFRNVFNDGSVQYETHSNMFYGADLSLDYLIDKIKVLDKNGNSVGDIGSLLKIGENLHIILKENHKFKAILIGRKIDGNV